MILQEPKVEFVPIELNKSILTSSVCSGVHDSGGVVVCTGSVDPANKDCPGCVADDFDWTNDEFCD